MIIGAREERRDKTWILVRMHEIGTKGIILITLVLSAGESTIDTLCRTLRHGDEQNRRFLIKKDEKNKLRENRIPTQNDNTRKCEFNKNSQIKNQREKNCNC